ncbi:MAG: hypothetical protein JWN37_610 [Candidatus Nomurabacteria bacterium]|nr:hypothetical protein [Candidatus Nomurabacteria bacterium]
MGERTWGKDRVILNEEDGVYTLTIYSNSNDNTLSQKAVEFLKTRV